MGIPTPANAGGWDIPQHIQIRLIGIFITKEVFSFPELAAGVLPTSTYMKKIKLSTHIWVYNMKDLRYPPCGIRSRSAGWTTHPYSSASFLN